MTVRRLTRRRRKALLTFHVASSVALVGIASAQLALGVVSMDATADGRRLIYQQMLTLVYAVTIPIAVLTVLNSLLLGLFTKWGLLLHWWVVTKGVLLLATVVLAIGVLRPALHGGHTDGHARTAAAVVPAVQLAVWLTATGLSVFKPWSRTPRGRRRAHEQKVTVVRTGDEQHPDVLDATRRGRLHIDG